LPQSLGDILFQSAPRAAREANEVSSPSSRSQGLFQSAPRAAREANLSTPISRNRFWVSIRASRCARGEPAPRLRSSSQRMFQSAPRAAREANLRPSAHAVFRSFVSIRASRCARGEPGDARECRGRLQVSIRASRCARGELPSFRSNLVITAFQSAPRAAREANSAAAERGVAANEFQSAPRAAREANPLASGHQESSQHRFNPRLALRARRTSPVLDKPLSGNVSIRASRCARGEL